MTDGDDRCYGLLGPLFSKKDWIFTAVYPRVKVKEDDHGEGRPVVTRKSPRSSPLLLGLKALEFLSIHDHHSPEQQPRVVFAECIARIPNSSVSNGATITNSIYEGRGKQDTLTGNKDTSSDNDGKAHIRASPVPRPRAVLSSRDNDAVIGKINSKATERSPALRNHDRLQTKNARLQFMVPVENIDTDAQLKRTVPVETVNVNGPGSARKPKAPLDSSKKHDMPKLKKDLPYAKPMNHRTSLRPEIRAERPHTRG